MLISLGYQVEIRENGKDAVDACLTSAFDLVLMDGYMPVMDGFEAAREIRRLERGRRTPIILLSASQCSKDMQRCLDAGVDGSLEKPVSLESLAAAVGRWLAASRAETAPESVVIPGIHR